MRDLSQALFMSCVRLSSAVVPAPTIVLLLVVWRQKLSADDRAPLADVSATSLPRSATCQPPPQVSTAAGPAWSARPFPPALPFIRRSSPPCLRRRRRQPEVMDSDGP